MDYDLSHTLQIAQRTDPGRVRSHNEDAVFADAAAGIVVLADGMGGDNAGEEASGMATTLLAAQLASALAERPPQTLGAEEARAAARQYLLEGIGEANAAVFRAPRASRSTRAWARRSSAACSTTTR